MNIRGGQAANASNVLANQDAQIKGAAMNTVGNVTNVMASDRRLKKNIIFKRRSSSGLNIYQFKYKDPSFGDKLYEGVMADEMSPEVIVSHADGYDRVDYSKIDVDFKTITI